MALLTTATEFMTRRCLAVSTVCIHSSPGTCNDDSIVYTVPNVQDNSSEHGMASFSKYHLVTSATIRNFTVAVLYSGLARLVGMQSSQLGRLEVNYC